MKVHTRQSRYDGALRTFQEAYLKKRNTSGFRHLVFMTEPEALRHQNMHVKPCRVFDIDKSGGPSKALEITKIANMIIIQ